MIFTALTGCHKEKKIYNVAIINGIESFKGLTVGFKEKMKELGYEEGKNINYIEYDVKSGSAEEKKILEDIVKQKPDLIFTYPTGSAIAAMDIADKSVPVLFGLASVEPAKLNEAIKDPNRNIAGLRAPSTGAVLKRLEYLLEIIPPEGNVYAAYNPDYQPNIPTLKEIRKLINKTKVKLIEDPCKNEDEFKSNLTSLDRGDWKKINGIIILPDDLTQGPSGWKLIRDFSIRHKIPISGGTKEHAETGAILGYAADFFKTGKLAALMADKILKGVKPAKIPLATSSMALYVNVRQAKEFGITIPEKLLNLATQIIN